MKRVIACLPTATTSLTRLSMIPLFRVMLRMQADGGLNPSTVRHPSTNVPSEQINESQWDWFPTTEIVLRRYKWKRRLGPLHHHRQSLFFYFN